MGEKVNPHLFARIMGLPGPIRRDFLEFMGQTPVCERELERLVESAADHNRIGKSKAS
jgi:hypothetical protein